ARGTRPPAHGLEYRRGGRGIGAVRRNCGGAVLLRTLVCRAAVEPRGESDLRRRQAHLGDPRLAVPRGGRERTALCHPVSPGEIRRSRYPVARQLDREPQQPLIFTSREMTP